MNERQMSVGDRLLHLVHRLEDDARIDPLVERLRPVADAAGSGRRGALLGGRWLGHALHPLMTDFPLGCWSAAGLLDIAGGSRMRAAAQRLVGLGLLFVPLTAASGMADWSMADDRRVKRVGSVHAAGNVLVAMCYSMSWLARRNRRYRRGVAFGMAGGSLAWVTGYLGGHMSFARGAGVGERGSAGPVSGTPGSTEQAEHDLLDVQAAAVALDVTSEQVEAMVAGDLLVPAVATPGALLFRRGDVLAVRLAGG